MIGVVILAGGNGSRAGLGYNKLLFPADAETVIQHTLHAFDRLEGERVLVVAKNDLETMRALFANTPRLTLTVGGSTRGASVQAGLNVCRKLGCDTVLIHDGARPYLSETDLNTCLSAVKTHGSCVMVRASTESVRVDGMAFDRDRVQTVSTPQAFQLQQIINAYAQAKQEYTDDAAVFESAYGQPHLEVLHDDNKKITSYDDLTEFRFRIAPATPRVGIGFDEHRYKDDRQLFLCGEHVPCAYGLDGHSDADAPLHALMNALLTAAGLGDIGTLFPDSDSAYLNADSTVLLSHVLSLVKKQGFAPKNVSIILHAQRPKLQSFVPKFRENIARFLCLSPDCVGISATTGEIMGHIGRGEGLACWVSCTLMPV